MHKGLALAIVAILGISMIGIGHMSGSDDKNDRWGSWWKSFDYKKYFDFKKFDYKKFVGFLNTGGSGNDDDDDDDDGIKDDPNHSAIDKASISFNIGIRNLDNNGEKSLQNIVDECIFESEESFEPLCIKCKFLDDDGTTVVAKGELIDLGQSYVANTEVKIPMTSEPPVADGAPAHNDVRNVHVVNLSVCGFECVPVHATFTDLKHGTRQTAINNALASSGITVSGVGNNGNNEVIIFDADKTGTADPDLQVGQGFHLLILPEIGYKDTNPADGYIDSPNDAAAGGTITIKMDTPKFLKSFVLVDHENDKTATAKAYSDHAGTNLVKSVILPITGDGKFTTVTMNAANVKRLDVTYYDSGGITNIDLKCTPPEQNCDCEKPDKFTVKYFGPKIEKVEISKNGKDKVIINGPFQSGDDIVVDAIALGFKNSKVYPETTYNFLDKYGKSKGTITIHTSCSQLLYVGQEFFYMKGSASEIKLVVVSGTLKGVPSIPDDASCPAPPQEEEPECIECVKPTKFTVKYEGPKDGVSVKIFRKVSSNSPSELVYTVPGTFNSGSNIEINSNNWGQDKVNPDTVYAFYKSGSLIGYVKIHTSCSQDLFIGDMFFYKQGDLSKQIKLTVVSGFDKNNNPAIPDSMCKDNTHDDDDDDD